MGDYVLFHTLMAEAYAIVVRDRVLRVVRPEVARALGRLGEAE